MKNIKLVASDLDGTLLNRKKEITPRLHQALTELDRLGVLFVPATGRPLGSVPQDIQTLPFLRYVITSNGAAIYDVSQKRNIIENYLTIESVDAVIEIARELPIITEYFVSGKAYINKVVYDNLASFELTESHIAYIKNSRTPIEDFWTEMKRHSTVIENINLVFRDLTLRKEVWDRLRENGLASVTASTTKNIEITALSATKGKALEKLCALLRLERKQVLAMGDGDNDMPMIQFAGIGVAMANGESHILEAADIIAEDCNDFGAAKILEQIIKSKQQIQQ